MTDHVYFETVPIETIQSTCIQIPDHIYVESVPPLIEMVHSTTGNSPPPPVEIAKATQSLSPIVETVEPLIDPTTRKVCPICSKELPPNGNLSFHMMLHPSGKPYACNHCLLIFKTKEELKKHVTDDHPEQCRHICKECGKVFSQEASMKRHRSLNHLNVMRYKCIYCDIPFKEYSQYRTHEAGHDNITNYQCHLCEVYFGSQTCLNKHLEEQECETKVLICCKTTFGTRMEYVEHTLLKHKKYKMAAQKCQYCGRTFPFMCIKRVHEETCILRNGNSGTDTSMNPGNGKDFPCDQCSRTFPSFRGLIKHKRIHSGVPARVNSKGDKGLICIICNKKLATASSLYTHRLVHTKERPFKCQYCDRTFPYKNSMVAHERSHTGERPFPCKYCDQRFMRYSAVQNHERRHTGEKPYSCRICGKAFLQHSTWRQHERTHSDRIECEKCGGVFSTRKDYKLHKKDADCQLNDRNECEKCGGVFSTRKEYKVHKKGVDCQLSEAIEEHVKLHNKDDDYQFNEVISEEVEERVEQILGQPAEMSTDKDGNVYVYYQLS